MALKSIYEWIHSYQIQTMTWSSQKTQETRKLEGQWWSSYIDFFFQWIGPLLFGFFILWLVCHILHLIQTYCCDGMNKLHWFTKSIRIPKLINPPIQFYIQLNSSIKMNDLFNIKGKDRIKRYILNNTYWYSCDNIIYFVTKFEMDRKGFHHYQLIDINRKHK